jgi:hypothetical protein
MARQAPHRLGHQIELTSCELLTAKTPGGNRAADSRFHAFFKKTLRLHSFFINELLRKTDDYNI